MKVSGRLKGAWAPLRPGDAPSVARQLAASPMMLFARRLENAQIQKRLHEANAAVAALSLSGMTDYPTVIEVAPMNYATE